MNVILRYTVCNGENGFVADLLAENSNLSKIKIKKCISAGGLWIKSSKDGSRIKRVKRIKTSLNDGDRITLYYDDNALVEIAESPFVIYENSHFGLWYKPVNILSQPSKYGDANSIDSIIKKIRNLNKDVFVVNRLDREASGIIAIAYDKKAAALLSKMWQNGSVKKSYQAVVSGVINEESGVISFLVEGKKSVTRFNRVKTDEDVTYVDVEIDTGRKHQIRRHFNQLGHPVMGDPLYGKNNSHKKGLMLAAIKLEFISPFDKRKIIAEVPEDKRLW
ncbi:MAG: RluA family pseudouridine synthase [Deltaproteobacteria bacterium]|nr:RluA family pseudouridine synthase [Deltaproteobacteria bacterium]